MITASTIRLWAFGDPFTGFLSTIKTDSRHDIYKSYGGDHAKQIKPTWICHGTLTRVPKSIYPKTSDKHLKFKMQAKHEAIPFGNHCCHIFVFAFHTSRAIQECNLLQFNTNSPLTLVHDSILDLKIVAWCIKTTDLINLLNFPTANWPLSSVAYQVRSRKRNFSSGRRDMTSAR